MKKIFAIAAIAIAMVACNNDSAAKEDAAKATADSIRVADSTAAANAQQMATDSASMMNDSAHKMMADTSKTK